MKRILYLVAIVPLFTACEKIIDLNLNSVVPKIVIEAALPEGKPCTVKITSTKDFGEDNYFVGVTNAIVTLAEEGQPEIVLPHLEKGTYTSNELLGAVGKRYSLTVKIGDQVYKAHSTMYESVPIDSIGLFKKKTPGDSIMAPQILFRDPAGVKNQYHFLLFMNDKQITSEIYAIDDEYADGLIVNAVLYFDVDVENKKEEIKSGDRFTVISQSIDEDVYEFYRTLAKAKETLTNPTSNFTGGALGVFNAYSSDTKSFVVH